MSLVKAKREQFIELSFVATVAQLVGWAVTTKRVAAAKHVHKEAVHMAVNGVKIRDRGQGS